MALLLEMNTVVIRVTPIARTAGYRLAEKLTQLPNIRKVIRALTLL
jgi:hypothetical protein